MYPFTPPVREYIGQVIEIQEKKAPSGARGQFREENHEKA